MGLVGSKEWEKYLYYKIFDVFLAHGMLDGSFALVTNNKNKAIEMFEEYLVENDIKDYNKSFEYSFSSGADCICFYDTSNEIENMSFDVYIEFLN
jgi:hypothetical protein